MNAAALARGGVLGWLLRRTDVRSEERRALLWSATLFFLLLFGYMLLRPVRDMMGARAGWHRVPSLARAVLIAMLLLQPVFGWIVARWPRRAFLPWIYGAFALQLVGLGAWALLSPPGDLRFAQVWFVWLSVFNLFVVSVFWGFMADTWAPGQAARLYGAIGVGGTLGAVLGGLAFAPLRGALAALDPSAGSRGSLAGLCLIGALALLGAVLAVRRVSAAARAFVGREASRRVEERVGGGVLDGLVRVARSPYLLGIALMVIGYTLTSTWGWAERIELVKRSGMSEGAQGDLSAWTESGVQGLTLLGQLLFTGALLPSLGVGRLLALGPVAAAAGFAALLAAPGVATAVGFVLLTRVAHFAFAKPAQEALFSVVERSDKYKAKSLVDTFVYRLSDWGGLETAALLLLAFGGTEGLSGAGLLVCLPWLLLALALGRAHGRRLAPG